MFEHLIKAATGVYTFTFGWELEHSSQFYYFSALPVAQARHQRVVLFITNFGT